MTAGKPGIVRILRRTGFAGFTFFLVKGLLWLVVPSLLWMIQG